MEVLEKDPDNIFNDLLMATKWKLLEISSVTVPANPEARVNLSYGGDDTLVDVPVFHNEELAYKSALLRYKEKEGHHA